jgi:hypothetical protein
MASAVWDICISDEDFLTDDTSFSRKNRFRPELIIDMEKSIEAITKWLTLQNKQNVI